MVSLYDQYAQEGVYARPHPHMRPHRFDIDDIRIPRVVLTTKHIHVGVGAPMHPWLEKLFEWYKIAPIQLSPNSYKAVVGLYILYAEQGYGEPTMEDLSYFYNIQTSSIGYFYLVAWRTNMGKGLSDGKAKRPPKSDLKGLALKKAENILKLPEARKNLNTLVSLENLKKYGFLPKGATGMKKATSKYKKVILEDDESGMTGLPDLFGAPTSSTNTKEKENITSATAKVSETETHKGKKTTGKKGKNQEVIQEEREDSPPRKKQNTGTPKANSLRVFNAFGTFGDANISEG